MEAGDLRLAWTASTGGTRLVRRVAFGYRGRDMFAATLFARAPLWQMRFASALLAIALGACSKPQPPTLTPQVARVVAVSARGLELDVEVFVENPNSFPLTASTVTGTLFVADGQKLGEGSARPEHDIPAEGSSIVPSRVHVAWDELPSLAPFLTRESVPYVFKGNVSVGSDSFNVTLPFTLSGQLTRSQLLEAGLRGL